MATTKRIGIDSPVIAVIEYCISDKEDDYKTNIDEVISYSVNDKTGEIIFHTKNAYQHCNKKTAIDIFNNQINKFGLEDKFRLNPQTKSGRPRTMYVIYQNFEGFEVNVATANIIGMELAETLFPNYPAIVSTHTNTDNIHNHICISAWDIDGKKYNANNRNYQKIRSVSDALCEKYKLSVLKNTKEQKLIKYRDKNGKLRYYEPTERKNQLLKNKEKLKGKIDDYRNTTAYENYIEKKKTNVEIVKGDIDKFLPQVSSYEELLSRLSSIGYTVNSKKVNGEWLKHISLKAPGTDKAVRDRSLDDNGFYKRDNLVKEIEKRSSRIKKDSEVLHSDKQNDNDVFVSGIKYFENYNYVTTDITEINEEYRVKHIGDDDYILIERTETEKKIISHVRDLDHDYLSNYNIENFYSVEYKTQKTIYAIKEAKQNPKPELNESVSKIQSTLNTIKFFEDNNFHTRTDLDFMIESLNEKHIQISSELNRINEIVDYYRDILSVNNKILALEEKINENKSDQSYLAAEYHDDLSKIKSYKGSIARYKTNTPEGKNNVLKKISDLNLEKIKLENTLYGLEKEIETYNYHIAVVDEAYEYEKHKSENKNIEDQER